MTFLSMYFVAFLGILRRVLRRSQSTTVQARKPHSYMYLFLSLKKVGNMEASKEICHGTLKMYRIMGNFELRKFELSSVFCKGFTRNSDGA